MLNQAGVPIEYSHSGSGNRLGLPFEAIAGRTEEWRDRRVIFMLREPRDTAVSCYFQATKRIAEEARFEGSIAEFIRHPGYGVDKIARFNLHWLQSAGNFRDFSALTYEGLHADTAAELSRVIAFATRRPADPRRVRAACQAGRFDNMRLAELKVAGKAEDRRTRLGGGAAEDRESLKTRKGKVGGFREYLSADDMAYCDEVLAGLDYQARVERLLNGLAMPPHGA
jgi:hypothetical protein